ncbi:MAG: riboflavin biosynthesis protein RibF [Omnitrophica WOR_2 bacterium RIFCSPHIGHO2_02_FULL_68_15]|nr:MAG: riboflavin biosynthesis protein RibF [Omnitrophica WOR_2 bacterium RIFCSPHIGHO2_02_FULL_68_15]
MSGPVVAIGIFDGVHRGHRAILGRAVRRARALGTSAVALTFWPHPAVVVAPHRAPPMLLSLDQRLAAFVACGIARTVVLRFSKTFARQAPERFVERVLVRRLRAREVVVGHDFRFGRDRAGTVETLRALARTHGIRVHVVPPVRVRGVRVSSKIIRRAMARGRLSTVRRYFGRPPTVIGRVVRGAGRGKRVGIPTANVAVTAGVLPPPGVYAVQARPLGAAAHPAAPWWPAVANLGWRPTVERRHPAAPVLEVHLLRRDVPPLRGRTLEVAFVQRLRPERRFPSVAALVAQIRRDIAAARRRLINV